MYVQYSELDEEEEEGEEEERGEEMKERHTLMSLFETVYKQAAHFLIKQYSSLLLCVVVSTITLEAHLYLC